MICQKRLINHTQREIRLRVQLLRLTRVRRRILSPLSVRCPLLILNNHKPPVRKASRRHTSRRCVCTVDTAAAVVTVSVLLSPVKASGRQYATS